MDKFEKYSIYSVTVKMKDENGMEDIFEFKPLEWRLFPKIYHLISKLSKVQGDSKEDISSMLDKFDEKTMTELLDIEFSMVKNSYPDMPDDRVQRFVMANVFDLIDPLVRLSFREKK